MSNPKGIQIEVAEEIPKLHSSYVAGVMKADSLVVGRFELNIPDDPEYVVIWKFEISPEDRGKGLGKACYSVLEKWVVDKCHPQEIYLELPVPQMVDSKPWNPKRFWKRVGFVVTRERTMKKSLVHRWAGF